MTSMEITLGGAVPEWSVGDKLRKARTWAGLTTEQMALDIGRSERTIRNYESGSTRPPVLVLRQYAFRTGVALAWLESGDGGEHAVISPVTSRYQAVSGLLAA